MQLTDKQLKIQERADKTLSFGCLIETVHFGLKMIHFSATKKQDMVLSDNGDRSIRVVSIPGHPMNRGRLCYLAPALGNDEREVMFCYFTKNPITLQQTVLERPEELQDLVLAFLETLPKTDANL